MEISSITVYSRHVIHARPLTHSGDNDYSIQIRKIWEINMYMYGRGESQGLPLVPVLAPIISSLTYITTFSI